jgi:hypothetical protein
VRSSSAFDENLAGLIVDGIDRAQAAIAVAYDPFESGRSVGGQLYREVFYILAVARGQIMRRHSKLRKVGHGAQSTREF